MTTLWPDVVHAFRSLRRTPAFAALVLVTLGLGVGATTAIFSSVNEVMLRPLPYRDPDRLVMLWESNVERGWDRVQAAPANVDDWRERVSAFTDVAMLYEYTSGVALELDGSARQVSVGQLSGNAFTVLGAPPLLGRTFTTEETWEDSPPVVVLSYGAWRNWFAADSGVVGRTIRLDGIAFEVIGVMSARFRSINDAEFWTTFRWPGTLRTRQWYRQAHVVRAVARLRDGVSYDQARVELAAVAGDLQGEHPELNRAMEAGLTPLQPFLVGERRTSLLLLFGAVLVLELLACANVANLLLVRSVARQRELAVRTALGAGQGRTVWHVFAEVFVLAIGGTLLGIGLSVVGLRVISTLSPPDLAISGFHLDGRVLGFAAGLTAASAVLFGILPALRSVRVHPAAMLADSSRTGTAGRSRSRATGSLVAVEIALAVMLVIGAGLLVRSLEHLRAVDPGVDVEHVLTFQISPPSGTYPTDPDRAELYTELTDRLRGIPGVDEVGASRGLPYLGWGWSSDFSVEGWGTDQFGIEVRHRASLPGYFAAMGIPVQEGKLFDERLSEGEPVPVVVNRAFADRYFPDESPVGRRVAFDRHPTDRSYWYPIVAVVGNERLSVTEEPRPEIISHILGDTPSMASFAVRTSVPPLSIVSEVRRVLADLDDGIPLVAVRTMREVAADALAAERFLMTMLGVFALTALVLAGVGVYGVAAQAARVRTREIGIRMALGAPAAAVVRLLLWRGAAVVGAGLVLGLGGAAAGGRLIENRLFGVEPLDPGTLVIGTAILTGVALLSNYLPARRATKLDPVSVLRAE